MTNFLHSPFQGDLDGVAQLSEDVIDSSIDLQRKRDRQTLEIRKLLERGVPVDELSNATGLSPDEIRAIERRSVVVLDELDVLTGIS